METGLLRAASSTPLQPLPRSGEPAPDTVKTELPASQNVQAATDTTATLGKDERAASEDVRLQIAAEKSSQDPAVAEARQRIVDRDAATGLTVVRIIEERSGVTVDQVPTEAYLRLKASIRAMFDAKTGAATERTFDRSA